MKALLRRPQLALLLLCLALYLPGLVTMPPLDRDEPRFAQASRQMLESGDFVAIRFQDEARNKKPVGIYWLQAASAGLLTDGARNAIWAYRLPSLLAAIALVLMTFRVGRLLFDDPAALTGAALLAASLLLVGEAHIAKTDAVLSACIVGFTWGLASLYRGSGEPAACRRTAIGMWFALGVGVLVKGPIAPLFVGLTVAGLALLDPDRRRWLRELRPLTGLAIVAVIVLPWVVAVQIATDGRFFAEAVGGDLLPKMASAQESHGAPPGTYLGLLLLTFWPGTLLLPLAAVHAWRRRGEPAIRFCLAWLIPAWITYELIPTKLPHYVLPLYPALALLAGAALAASREQLSRSKWPLRLGLVPWTIVGLALATAVAYLPTLYGRGLTMADGIAAAVIGALVVATTVWGWRTEIGKTATGALATAVVAVALVLGWTGPRLDALWVSRSVAAAIPERTTSVAASGFAEPSLVFLLGTDTRLVPPGEAADLIASGDVSVAVVSADTLDAFTTRLATLAVEVETVATVTGFNYSKGDPVVLHIVRRAS